MGCSQRVTLVPTGVARTQRRAASETLADAAQVGDENRD